MTLHTRTDFFFLLELPPMPRILGILICCVLSGLIVPSLRAQTPIHESNAVERHSDGPKLRDTALMLGRGLIVPALAPAPPAIDHSAIPAPGGQSTSYDLAGHWALQKGSSPDFDPTGPNVSIVELRPTDRGFQMIPGRRQPVDYIRSPENPNRYTHARASIISITFTDPNHGRIEATGSYLQRLQGTVTVTVTNRREFDVMVTRHDTGEPMPFAPDGQPAGFLFSNGSRTATLPRGVRIQVTDLLGANRYLEWYPVVRNNDQVIVDGFSLTFTNNTNTELAIYDLDNREVNSGLIAELPARGGFARLSANRNQRIAVLDFATGTAYFSEKITRDTGRTFESMPQNVIELLGTYQRDPVQNNWHRGRITMGSNRKLIWSNEAGVSWTLRPDLNNGKLLTEDDNPYQRDSIRDFTIERTNGRVSGFRFNGELYRRTPG